MVRRRLSDPADQADAEVEDRAERRWERARHLLWAIDGPTTPPLAAFREAWRSLAESKLPVAERAVELDRIAGRLGLLEALDAHDAHLERCRERDEDRRRRR